MDLNITFKKMIASEAVRSYTQEKSLKLKKYFNGRITVTWNFVVEKKIHVAHCHLLGKNLDFFGEAKTPDMYASIDMAVDKIEKQLKKHKEIVKKHHTKLQ